MALLPVEVQVLIEMLAGLWAGLWLAALGQSLVYRVYRFIQSRRRA